MTNIYVDFPTLKGSESRIILLKFMKVCVIYPIENNPPPLLFILSKSNGSQSFKIHHENENSHLPIPFSFFFQNPTNH